MKSLETANKIGEAAAIAAAAAVSVAGSIPIPGSKYSTEVAPEIPFFLIPNRGFFFDPLLISALI